MSINRMYYGTKKIYSFLENGNQGGECNCEQEYQNGYNQGYQDGLANCTGGSEDRSNPFITELGWDNDDVINMLQDVDDYAIRKMQEWDASSDSANEYFREDPYDNRTERLVFAPMLDTSNVSHFGLMFYGCKCLVGVPKYNTSNATFFAEMFGECHSIKSIPDFDTRNVYEFTNCFKSCSVLSEGPNWDFGNAASVRDLFAFCGSLTTIPRYNFSNVGDIGEFFGFYGDEMSVVNLGGFEGLKVDWNDGNGLDRCPNLTYESIMNVINDLYDFRGNGDNDTTRTLKINTNTMALLSDEDKQIAINKGWMLTE